MRSIKSLKAIFNYINKHPLAGKHKLRAYFNFFRWQARCRISKGPHRVPFVHHTVLMAARNMTGATGNIYLGLHDFSEMGFLLHFLRSNDHFMDVGANVGSYTVLAAGLKGANCLSFEPVPQTFGHLQRNVQANELNPLVKCINAGVGANNTSLYFTSHFDSVNHVIPESSILNFDKVVKVPIVRLDEFISTIDAPLLIKIDVEGFETEVLNGMPGLLGSHYLKGIIIELNGSGNRYGFDENKIHSLFIENGFEPYGYDPFTRSLTLQSTFGKFNTIYLRDIDFVKERVQNAPKIKVFSQEF